MLASQLNNFMIKRFRDYLFELADAPYMFEQLESDVYAFTTKDGSVYQVIYDIFRGELDFYFRRIESDGKTAVKLTHTGDAFRIFSTIKEILFHIIEIKSPRSITFTASTCEPSRIKLYDRMLIVLAEQFPRYEASTEIEYTTKHYDLRTKK